ncbi:MAG: hypothetical protein GY705_15885 [Bacteroidetes bacterium]|nr:hypothetical protein [Bacteroidota bacterium]
MDDPIHDAHILIVWEPYLELKKQFKEKPTFKIARNLWWHCYKHDLTMPEKALKMFAQEIGKQVQSYPKSETFMKKFDKKEKKHRKDLKTVKDVKDLIKADNTLKVQSACIKLSEETNKEWQAIEQAYYRAKKNIRKREKKIKKYSLNTSQKTKKPKIQ